MFIVLLQRQIIRQQTDGLVIFIAYIILVGLNQGMYQKIIFIDQQQRITIFVRKLRIKLLFICRHGIIGHKAIDRTVDMVIIWMDIHR